MAPPALLHSRFRAVLIVLATLLAFFTLVRLGLAAFNADSTLTGLALLAPALLLGALYDLPVAMWWAMPVALLVAFWPDRPRAARALAWLAASLAAALFAGLAFVGVSEFVFWNEFESRFNFIAVDYLVYTREVIGNIRESYPLELLLGLVALIAAFLCAATAKPFLNALALPAGPLKSRTAALAIFTAVAACLTAGVGTTWKEVLSQPQIVQLAGNGVWEFFHSFNHNEIDFDRYYTTMSLEKANAVVRAEYKDTSQYEFTNSGAMPIERRVFAQGAQRDLNVVLVSIESMGAEWMQSLGGRKGLTPNLERLAAEGMYFTKLYATGTRTVRGLEALTLSVPPTPGHAIPMRPNNGNLFTLGGVFRSKGYDALYLYGGYSYFDNMKSFFGGNGYTVIDRTAIAKEAITHENIWGVADEDLFRLAIREMDARSADGRKVFMHVMTTSNHRPYTYPAGRIDIASGQGREGAVKYTDYAIGKFIEEARAKPWFDDTVFVFVADHTSIARNRMDLWLRRYHIPLVIYAPRWVEPRRVNTVSSQIDVAPTVLGLLNMAYVSQFYGRDILRDGIDDPHVYIANNQTVGFLDEGVIAELKPRRRARAMNPDNNATVTGKEADDALEEGIALYQTAALRFSARTAR
jgi:phosphoglycerol transferase MdoB-like AlkP superfamily enzyme